MDLIHNRNNFSLIDSIKTSLIYGNNKQFPEAKLTVCITTYKRPNTLKEAIKSVIFQNTTINDYYISIIDNDNSDSTEILDIVKSFNDCRVLYYKNEKNIGMQQNCNRGIQIATTPFVALLHDDDLLCPNYIETIYKIIKKTDSATVCYLNAYYQYDQHFVLFPKDSIPHVSVLKRFAKNCVMFFFGNTMPVLKSWYSYFVGNYFGANTCGILINRKLFLDTGGFNPEYHPYADWVFFQFLTFSSIYEIRFIHHSLAVYRWGINASLDSEVAKKTDYGTSEFMKTLILNDKFLSKIHRLLSNSNIKKYVFSFFIKYIGMKTFSKRKIIRNLSEIGITNLK